MTSRANQIQSMIADIDKLLAHKGKRLWGAISSQDEPRQILQRIRDFLASETETEGSAQAQSSALVAKFVQQGNQESSVSPTQTEPLQHQLSGLIEPLKAELKMLFEERANLVDEIRDLEKKRLHDYSLAQQLASQEKIISEFMQVLKNRLADDIDGGISTGYEGTISGTKALPASGNRADSAQVQRLNNLTNDLDQRLVALDGTVNVVFEALQRNIHAYHDSLSEALARMHYKGVQGEQLLERFIKNVSSLPQQQVYTESLPETTDKISLESIDAEGLESRQEVSKQNLNNSQSIELEEVYNQASKENLEVTLDETIDNIEFSQSQEDYEDNSITDEIEAAFSQIDEQDEKEEFSQQLETDNNLEFEFLEEEQEKIEPEIVAEPDAFDSPEKMQAVLSELQKSAAAPEELTAASSSEKHNEDEVDELYASLFDGENLTSSSTPKPPSQIRSSAIEVENPSTSNLDSQITQAATEEKEVVSQEVVFEPTPPSSTVETSESSPENQSSQPDAWFNSRKLDLANSSKATENPKNTGKTSIRKIQPKAEDTITSLTELFAEEVSPEVVATPENSQSKPEVVATEEEKETLKPSQQQQTPVVEEEIAESSQQQQTPVASKKQTPKPRQQQQTPGLEEKEENLIQQINTAATSQANQSQITIPSQEKLSPPEINPYHTPFNQPNQNLDTSAELTQLPQTEKTIPPSEENYSQDNSASVNATEIPSPNKGETVWYLGLDLGTTGISAALLNRSTTEIHPVYWLQENQAQTPQNHNFRLPAEVYLPKTTISQDTNENPAEQNIYSAYLKPYLQISLAYKSISETASTEVRQKWEPILQLNEFSTVPLVWIIRSLSKLLLTLKSDSNSTTLGLTATAIGIQKEEFNSIINNIAGVICTCPSNWSEQYRFNIRESLIISKLVEHSQQVFFVEEAIASLIGELEGANGEIVKLVHNDNSPAAIASNSNLLGNTLVINIGASATEMTLVDLPDNLQDLTHNEFMLHGFTCGGKAMEQDIITQLLLPAKWRKSRNTKSEDDDNNPLKWTPNIPGLEQIRFSSLGLEHFELPRAGEPDISQRIRLQQRLESSPLGKALLDAAIALKLILQRQESFIIELADQRWELHKRDLETQVFVPFVRRINRELNKLLVTRGIPTEAINQVILSGGVSSIKAISRWLKQKLPSATIIQEEYLSENLTPACSRVATGLCVLPLHPLVLEIPRQQYTDYFLFTELLRLIPEKAVSFGEVIQLFEARGINTRTCQQRLLAFLEGEIPPGLIPNNQDIQWLNQSSKENSNYKAISASPLFDKQGSLSYRPNLQQLKHLRNYLDTIQASAHQSLEEPYTVNFAVGVGE